MCIHLLCPRFFVAPLFIIWRPACFYLLLGLCCIVSLYGGMTDLCPVQQASY